MNQLDPITLSVLTGALNGVVEEMGATLVRGAYSSNIKERRDSSAALFDAAGAMVAQAAHIPVHLGAMPEAVAAVRDRGAEPGDVWLLNDPFRGGTHLPDITMVSPVVLPGGGGIVAYAVTRAHHNDVGGMSPGSMPADSTEIFQEGLIIPPVRIVASGELVTDVLDLILANVRVPEVRRGDLRAQIAGNGVAATRLVELVERHDRETVLTAFGEVIAYADRRTRALLADLPDGSWTAEGVLEGATEADDQLIRAAVMVAGDRLTIDFAGTAPQGATNLNCPLAVTRSACFFALRVLLPDDVPANAGTYSALDVRAEPGTLLNATWPAAVVAGNVETSQRTADVVLTALAAAAAGTAHGRRIPAEGMGTMNNLVLGGKGWSYYETIGGGQGASAAGAGPSGVHVGMSNTLNTPVEALELEYPLRVERYQLRRGTGGAGRHRGGDGIERSVRVLEPATLSLMADRRRHRAEGRAGGQAGQNGEDDVDGEPLAPKERRVLAAGSVVTVRTPGGGGWGRPD